MFEWEEVEQYPFDDSDRFEEVRKPAKPSQEIGSKSEVHFIWGSFFVRPRNVISSLICARKVAEKSDGQPHSS